VKVLSRFASPAGFVLVLLLFLLLPFVSVSCDVPGYGEAGVNYTGTHLVTGATPEIPDDLQRVASDPETPAELVDPPAPGVQVLGILLALLAAAGVLTALVPQIKARLLTGTALAAATLAVTVITMAVAQSNLQSALIDGVRRSGLADQQETLHRVEAAADELAHTEVGFWLMIVLLALITLVTGTLGLFGHRLHPSTPTDATESGGLDDLSLAPDDHDESPPDSDRSSLT
jgi:hypothetical protein